MDRIDHFVVMVGQLLDEARLGGVLVRLTSSDGVVVEGLPLAPAETAGGDQLDDTGYPRWITLAGRRVDMTDVREAAIVRPPALD